eukprot:TRINITY_DN4676_c0_g2_i1.p1 TRINITY_DN4676_c0_g2~~TRINITY_DN4676_c0_g2_i1.p1  ORF type:complete len:681 (+),score=225.33 TRINITY_DN4676_c0_g2_i1:58-2100(+)
MRYGQLVVGIGIGLLLGSALFGGSDGGDRPTAAPERKAAGRVQAQPEVAPEPQQRPTPEPVPDPPVKQARGITQQIWAKIPSDPNPSLPRPTLNSLGAKYGSKRYGGTKEAPAPGVAGHDRWLENFLGPLRQQRTRVRVLLLGPLQKADAEVFREYFAPSGVHLVAVSPASDVGDHVERFDGDCVSVGRNSFDVVIDSGSGPKAQLSSLRNCFSALKGGGVWAVEGLGGSYDLGARHSDLDPQDTVSAAKLLIDMVNAHFWDKRMGTSLLHGVSPVETVYFAEDFIAITRVRSWTNEFSGLPLAFFSTHGRPKGPPVRLVDSASGVENTVHSYEYYSGDPSMAWMNPPCAAAEARFGSPDTRIPQCKAALDELYEAAARSADEPHPFPRMGAGWPLTDMDKLATSIQWNLTDKVHHHRYDRWYTWYMEGLRSRKLKMMEIGMFLGGSAKLWTKYFPDAEIYGVDLEAPALDAASEQTGNKVKVLAGDQSKTTDMKKVTKEAGPGSLDIIIDDGGHATSHMVTTFKVMFRDLLKPGGLYTIEDIETSYWGWNKAYSVRFTGGLQKRGTMMEVSKLLVDTVNRRLWDPKRERCVIESGSDALVESIQFARNVIIMTKKGRYGRAWEDRPRPEPIPSGPPKEQPPLAPRVTGPTWDGSWYIPRPQCEATAQIRGHGGRRRVRR